jgi:UDPglucose 6-dehydrogenase
MTPWSSYSSLPVEEVRKLLRGNVIIDPYAILDEVQYRNLGFEYHRLGK